ncbi:MAG TPA: oligosaccharide flippase family protein [Myxococcaceae bacterium]|nr:oligosaccharide flippase family protein [Myxococcaceae bacterium]
MTAPAPAPPAHITPQTPDRPGASLARNAFHLVLGQAGTMVLGILFSAALGRTLGVGDFGLYFLISSFASFALVLVDWGQQFFGIRAVARTPERAGELLGTGLVLRAVGTALVCIPTGLSAWALGYDRRSIWFAVAFVALNLPLFLAQNFGVVFRGRDRMGLDATVSVANRFAGLVLALAALALGLGLGGVVVAQGLAGCAALALAAWLYRQVERSPLRFSRTTAREILVGGTALMSMNLATNVQPYIDAILLSELVPKEAVGWYGAAKTLMGTLLAPSLILGAAAFPRLSRAAGNVEQFHREMRLADRPMVWLGGLAAVGTWHFAEVAIRIVYGSKGQFAPAGIILGVFGLGLFLVFVDVLLGTAATALGKATAFSIMKIATVVLATGLELVLIPWFQRRTGNGGIGVVTAFVGCELLVFLGLLTLMPRGTARPVLVDGGRALLSALGTGALLHWLPPLSPWLAIPLCIVVFTLLSILSGLVRRHDLHRLRAQFRRDPVESPVTPAPGTTLP